MAHTLCSIEKNHKEASTVANYILVYLLHLYGEEVLSMFNLYYQDLAKVVKWIDSQPYYKDKIEFNDAINNDIDLK